MTQPLVDPQQAAELRGVPPEVAAADGAPEGGAEAPVEDAQPVPNQRTVGAEGAWVRLAAEDDSPVVATLEPDDEVLVQGFVLDSAGSSWFVTSGGRARVGQFIDDTVEGLTDLTQHSVPAPDPSIEAEQPAVMPTVVVLDASTIDQLATLVVEKLLAAQRAPTTQQ